MTDLELAIGAVDRGLIVGLPTDTVYGIGADPERREAVEALYRVKHRPEDRAIPILAGSLTDARGVGIVPDGLDQYWPGPLTVVVRKMPATPSWIGDPERDTVAIRIPAHPLALELLARTGPLAVTSANRSGQPPAGDDVAARAALGEAVAVYLPGAGSGGAASTVVDLTGPEPVVLRPGPVTWGR